MNNENQSLEELIFINSITYTETMHRILSKPRHR